MRWPGRVVLAVGAIVAGGLHVQAGFRFPYAWPDEAHFLTPALNLAERGSLAAPQLNAPEGMFWMPDGFAALYGAVFTVAPDTMLVARWVSFALILACAGLLYASAVRLDLLRLPAAGLLALWLVSPGVVIAGNIARMEALVLALVGAGVFAAAAGRWPVALAVAAASVLVHPIGVVVFLAFVLAALAHRGHVRLRPTALEWGLAGAVLVAFTAEAAWFAAHLPTVVDHLGFQLARKASRSPTPGALAAQSIAVGLVAAALSVWARRWLTEARASVLTALAALTAGFAAVFAVGQEIWYAFLRTEGVLLLAGLAVLVVAARHRPRVRPGPRRQRAAAVGVAGLSVLVVLAGAGATQARPLGFAMADAPRGEWGRFVQDVVRRLEVVDARLERPALVTVDRASALGYPLSQRDWQHLRFVSPTAVSPLEQRAADFVAYSIVPWRDTRVDLYQRMPESLASASVLSASGTYEFHLHPAATAVGRGISR
jgi:energy-converting hydrogenase Eha subunit C